MKTLKKIFPWMALLCLLGGLYSCDDDCGCDPVISYIIPANASKDSLIVGANAEEYIIIVGENLSRVVQVWFDNVPSEELNPNYMSDNYIILKIPEISSSTRNITLITIDGRRLTKVFDVSIPKPVISMFYSEFVPAGGTLRVKGKYFFAPKVSFLNEENGTEVFVNESDVEVVGSTELKIVVPASVGINQQVVVETASGKSASKILFRDRRNMIIDFSYDYPAMDAHTLIQDWDNNSCSWDPAFDIYEGDLFFPESGCDDNFFGQINKPSYGDHGTLIAYDATRVGKSLRNLFGEWVTANIDDMVLKFEVNVSPQYPVNGLNATIYITPDNFGGVEITDYGRFLTGKEDGTCVPGAFWTPYEINFNKSEPDNWEIVNSSYCKKDFSTEGWMTVAIPLSEFKWSIIRMDLLTGPFHVYGTTTPNTVAYIDRLDPAKCYSFAFILDPATRRQKGGDAFIYFDNFRIVPDDGNGAVFDKYGQRKRYY